MTAAATDLSARCTAQEVRIAALEQRFEAVVKAVIPIGVAMLGARDFHALLEQILLEAKALCHADGGTLGGAGAAAIPYPPLPLYDASGTPNEGNVATWTALRGAPVNIADAYAADGFEFSGTIAFDARTGYRSMSFLTVPLKNAQERVIGVLQLLNAQDPASGAVVPFDPGLVPVVESLSTLAAAALEVYAREDRLRQEIRELHVQIDEAKRARQVAEIADTDYFQTLQKKARQLRERP